MNATPRYYDIKDAARCLGVAPSTLRYWESQGLVRASRDERNDYRRYALHDVLEAGEIAFYRQLGVPVRDLASYRAMSISALDDALGRTEDSIEQRIAELETMRTRLARQRSLNAVAEELRVSGMRPATPAIERLTSIDYNTSVPWNALIDEPWCYAVLIRAEDPSVVHEAVADEAGSASPLWVRTPSDNERTCRECLLKTTPELDGNNAAELFDAATRSGLHPRALVGTYLVTATEPEDGSRWDYYRSWIVT
ncbi:MerR family transcriptional regulator [Paraeggerthella sp.]|uniref:MerR family transcriptional regulator n=1 Tax=Paraeggerthella sp. TaxID=2897350 RepID=UPI003AB362A5